MGHSGYQPQYQMNSKGHRISGALYLSKSKQLHRPDLLLQQFRVGRIGQRGLLGDLAFLEKI